MAHAYTPGLKVTDLMTILKKRILPLKGQVVVKKGDKVTSDTVVARTELPGVVEPINVANILGIPPQDVPEAMVTNIGDHVTEGDVIAKSKSFFGLFSSSAKARISGTVENISHITGQVLLRGAPVPVEVKAYLNGVVTNIYEREGVEVTTKGSFVQGIFGIGPETHGPIKMLSKTSKEILTEKEFDASCKGWVVVGGSIITAAGLRKAIEVGAVGIVVGGFNDKDLRDFLGYDLGVAITGSEDKGITLVVTEGFGEIMMAQKTFDLLRRHEGQEACINGATQIRAGVIRPEVVIPKMDAIDRIGKDAETEAENPGLTVGSPVRVIRQPYFGRLGTVTNLPPQLQMLESESKARVLEVEFADGKRSIIPRANVEMLE
jgi:transcription antitermination factor NusG